MRDVLVVDLLGGLGDLLLALPAVHALALSHPQARVHVATFDPAGQLLERDPLVASCLTTDDHSPGAARRFVQEVLDRREYDLAVTTTTYDGIPDLLRSRVPHVVADLWRRPPAHELVDERFLRLLVSDGVVRPDLVTLGPTLALDPAEVAEGHRLLGPAVPVLLLPAAGMVVKRWRGWASLVAALHREAGTEVDVVALPAPGERLDLPGARVLEPLALRAVAGLAAAVAQRGGVAVGADTGPVRLAAAAGCRTVGLFGPTLAARYGQRGSDGHVGLQGLPGCTVRRPTAITEQACWWQGRCPLSDWAPACMADLRVTEVVAAVRRCLPGAVPATR